ncbi:hypothetical protein FIN92_04605 [Prevotella brunnea]|uniref:hypothetical protein n=1 Tax=Prevotella brunnea TaxID=2508867 RepID=UPI0028062129|nr:hypothetical protein [Prevotella brunnea]MDR0185864.1 hypothetical protein [Prevotella brunnea]
MKKIQDIIELFPYRRVIFYIDRNDFEEGKCIRKSQFSPASRREYAIHSLRNVETLLSYMFPALRRS